MTQPGAELNEIRQLIATIQSYSGGIGEDPLLGWLAQGQGKESAQLEHPRLCAFMASHGFAKNLPPQMDYGKFTKDCLGGTGRLNRLALAANTDLRLYEMDAADATEEDGPLEESDLVRSMAYGMMAVEPGLDLMAAAGFGHGSAISAQALIALHHNQNANDLNVARLIKAAQGTKGIDALMAIGGYELAALCGVIIAARLANCPVLLEGVQGYAAYLVLKEENPALIEHCRLCGATGADEEQIEVSVPVITTSEPGLNLACAIQSLRTHVILNDGSSAQRPPLSQAM